MNKKNLLLGILLAFFILSGCASKQKEPEVAPSAPQPVTTNTQDSLHSYYDFDDIPVPTDMKLVPKKSILFESAAIKAGVVSFEGRVDAVSLFDFYVNTMPQENWTLRSYFKYGQYILVFEKPNKDCIIHIQDGSFTTEMQAWVTPRIISESTPNTLGPKAE